MHILDETTKQILDQIKPINLDAYEVIRTIANQDPSFRLLVFNPVVASFNALSFKTDNLLFVKNRFDKCKDIVNHIYDQTREFGYYTTYFKATNPSFSFTINQPNTTHVQNTY